MSDIFEKLSAEARKLARIPRLGKLIALLPAERFARLTSKASTYWEVYTTVGGPGSETGLLDSGLSADGAHRLGWHVDDRGPDRTDIAIRKWQMRLARNLLSALAFEMMLGDHGTGTTNPLEQVEKGIDSFRQRVATRLTRDDYRSNGPYSKATGKAIDDDYLLTDLGRLGKMNSQGLDHIVGELEKERIFFGDVTVRNFFAAFWAVRWANDEDRELMTGWIPDPHQGEDHRSEYREFWEMAIELREMTQDSEPLNQSYDKEKWELLFSPLFDGSLTYEDGEPIRSTELMYRTWGLMEGTAARKKFSGEFEEFINGSDEDKKRVALELLYVNGDPSQGSQFIRLADPEGTHTYGSEKPPVPDWHQGQDDGRFPSGGAVKQFGGDRVEPFLLSRVCLTNDQFELFDRVDEITENLLDEDEN